MTIDRTKVEYYLNELQKRGKPISGGVGRQSFELRDPEYYWNFGSFLVEQAQQVDEDKQYDWIYKQTKKIEKEILGPVANDDWLVPKIFEFVNELQDKDHFMYVADIAGHKVGTFRIKVMDYIYEIYSKKNPSKYSESQKNKLAEKLQKKLTHDEINGVLREFRGKTSLGYGIEKEFRLLSHKVEDAVDSENFTDMESLKNEIGPKMIDKLRTYLQILSLSEQSLFDEVYDENKKALVRKTSTQNESAGKLSETFGKCVKDKDLRKKIIKKINSYEMGQFNNYLNAIESKDNFEDWKRTKENFEQMGD